MFSVHFFKCIIRDLTEETVVVKPSPRLCSAMFFALQKTKLLPCKNVFGAKMYFCNTSGNRITERTIVLTNLHFAVQNVDVAVDQACSQ